MNMSLGIRLRVCEEGHPVVVCNRPNLQWSAGSTSKSLTY